MGRAFHIDAANRRIVAELLPEWHEGEDLGEFSQRNLTLLQGYVGGYIERACVLPSGDSLFVDEEGAMKPQEHFWRLAYEERPYAYAGSGIIVGKEKTRIDPTTGDEFFLGQQDAKTHVRWLLQQVIFMTREQAEALAKANASETAVGIITVDENGVMSEPRTLVSLGEFYARMPKPPKKEGDGHG